MLDMDQFRSQMKSLNSSTLNEKDDFFEIIYKTEDRPFFVMEKKTGRFNLLLENFKGSVMELSFFFIRLGGALALDSTGIFNCYPTENDLSSETRVNLTKALYDNLLKDGIDPLMGTVGMMRYIEGSAPSVSKKSDKKEKNVKEEAFENKPSNEV